MRKRYRYCLLLMLCCCTAGLWGQDALMEAYNISWLSQSKNAGESMPVGGGGIGCNVWVENNELLLYFSQSGSFDENNAFLKSGRLRLKLSPNPFNKDGFRQELVVKNGYIDIQSGHDGIQASLRVWVDVFNPVVHIDISANKAIKAEAVYENWRFADRVQKGKENNANSWKWASHVPIITKPDHVISNQDEILFFHSNISPTVFDATVKQQGLDSLKSRLFNPLEGLTSGGILKANNFVKGHQGEGQYLNTKFKSWSLVSKRPEKKQSLQIFLHHSQVSTIEEWNKQLKEIVNNYKANHHKTIAWWNNYWKRSFIIIDPAKAGTDSWQLGRNYQLFRYMLGCNAYGKYPTKFNGGLFTVDPVLTDTSIKGTPDHRNWGGGTFTAQNQRLVYWPMLRSGDIDMMTPQFDFYNRLLPTAELRTKAYWGHAGANFNEQIENFGFPNPTEYGWKRSASFDPGVEYNAWLEYEWDTVLEFCMMMLQSQSYAGKDITAYLPLIKKALIFFDEHYQYQAKKLSNKALDGNGRLILYPGSGAETFKMAYNASSTIAALKAVTAALLKLPAAHMNETERKYFEGLSNRIPPIPFTTFNDKPTIAPATVWSRVNNVESSQLYPVYPWGLYGVGRPGLDTARNTYWNDSFALKFRSHVGWKQDNIFAARLGLTQEAKRLNSLKLKNSDRRFPTFWGPGFDWVPDHNWGGSGMIGLQEMLMQTVDNRIYLFPAWPKEWDVHFKLHAPQQTTVEATLKNGKIVSLQVLPVERKKDIIVQLE